MNIIIAGSSTFQDYELLERKMDTLTAQLDDIVVFSGYADGADKLGERWAFENRFTVKRFRPDWKEHGKQAGIIRNQEMLTEAGPKCAVIVFWDGQSKGSKDMIDRAKKAGVKLKVIRIDTGDDSNV